MQMFMSTEGRERSAKEWNELYDNSGFSILQTLNTPQNSVCEHIYANGSSLEESACLGKKNIGKPCTGKLYARFDEEGLVKLSMEWILRHRQTKGTETDRRLLTMIMTSPLLYPELHWLNWIFLLSN